MPDDNIQSFQLPDGRTINVNTGKQESLPNMVTIPTNREAKRLVTETRRKLVDLPDVPTKMNVISVVVAYTLFGLDDQEIALALGVEVKRITAIKMLDAYAEMLDSVIDGIKSRDLDPISKLIEQHAEASVNKIVEIMNDADSDKTSLAAARDLLDRSGRRPADVHEHRVMHEGGLVIEHIERSEHADLDGMSGAIDADFSEVENNGDSS